MRRRFFAAASLLVLALGVVTGFAQRPRTTVEVPFNFVACGTELPAGAYRIGTDTANPSVIVVRSEKGDQTALCPVITRLSRSESPRPQVVFDKVGEKRFLAEVYIPGVDGYQVAGTPGEHTHQKVSGESK